MKKIIISVSAGTFVMAASSAAFAQAATQDVNITATVPKYCSVAGSATPTALNTTIPVSATGTVTTTAQNFTVNSVVCNTAADVVATSVSGGVRSATAAPSGFTNIINYTGVAAFGSASSTVNTATVPAAAGAERKRLHPRGRPPVVRAGAAACVRRMRKDVMPRVPSR